MIDKNLLKIEKHDDIHIIHKIDMDVDTLVTQFSWEHRYIFDSAYYNHPVNINDNTIKMLKLTDPRTFDYRTITTAITFIFDYKSTGYPNQSKIMISTIDDAHMNLWLKKQNDDTMWEYIRYFKRIPMLYSCEFEYERFITMFSYLIYNKEVMEISFN